jgi:hypothetical protein
MKLVVVLYMERNCVDHHNHDQGITKINGIQQLGLLRKQSAHSLCHDFKHKPEKHTPTAIPVVLIRRIITDSYGSILGIPIIMGSLQSPIN